MKFQILNKSIYYILSIIVLTSSDEYSDLEQKYVERFGNDPQNPEGQWPEAKGMAENETLVDFCSRTHFLNERTSYEVILDPCVQDGILNFIRSNGTYKPMQITVVNYTSHKEKLDYYITKGMRDDCLFYLNPLDEQKSSFHLTQHLCDCIFF